MSLRISTRPLARLPLAVAALTFVLAVTSPRIADAQGEPKPVEPKAGESKPAEPKKTASLGWTRLEGAESCTGTRELAEAVEKILQRSVFVSAAQADLSIEGRVEKVKTGSGFKATLSITDKDGKPQGTRELATESTDCHALDDQVSLAVALIVDPDAVLAPPKPPPEEKKEEPPKEQPKEKPKPEKVYIRVPEKPKEEEPDPWRGDVFAGFSLGFGWLPEVSPGAHVGASIDPPWFFPVEVTLKFFTPQTVEAPRDATVLFYSFQGAALGCPVSYAGSVAEIRACGGLEGGFLVGDGEGFDTELQDVSAIRGQLGATVKGRVDFKIVSPLRLGLATGVTVPFFRDEFVFQAPSGKEVLIFQQAPVAGTIDFYAMLAFP
ncbi:MAG: hypothetical protein HOV80_03670 [Polyangiaceae bacterium]|nr:hypothetical protein [Polyangiaceae bacterium]